MEHHYIIWGNRWKFTASSLQGEATPTYKLVYKAIAVTIVCYIPHGTQQLTKGSASKLGCCRWNRKIAWWVKLQFPIGLSRRIDRNHPSLHRSFSEMVKPMVLREPPRKSRRFSNLKTWFPVESHRQKNWSFGKSRHWFIVFGWPTCWCFFCPPILGCSLLILPYLETACFPFCTIFPVIFSPFNEDQWYFV